MVILEPRTLRKGMKVSHRAEWEKKQVRSEWRGSWNSPSCECGTPVSCENADSNFNRVNARRRPAVLRPPSFMLRPKVVSLTKAERLVFVSPSRKKRPPL